MVEGRVRRALWLLWLLVFTLSLYLRGFLLTKIEIEKFSSCHDYEHGDCWSKPRYKRAVLVLVDALRHDFTLYDSSVKDPQPWQNKMPVFSELRKQYPHNTRHLEFIGDPPTATFLRLKGLTTGGLPTFVDLGSNFGASEITEDSWVKQLALNKKNLVLLGDDTWMNIYSRYFYRAFPYPSFDVWDLHTVDNGVWQHLIPQMRTSDWDVIVAHFLGVDHAGHRYHVNHPKLSDKLAQVNDWVREIVDNVEEDTVLFVFGDHGMTSSGDHGGETKDEVTSTLFVYSGSKFGSMTEEEESVFDPFRVFQTDIVPTLTMLLGVPIPYSSLGSVIPFLFLSSNSEKSRRDLQQVLNTNMNQVFKYIEAYSMISSEFSSSDITKIRAQIDSINTRFNTAPTQYSFTLVQEMIQVIRRIRNLCSQHWAQFNLPVMMSAIVIMVLLSLSFIVTSSFTVSWWAAVPMIPALIISYDKLSPLNGTTHCITTLLTLGTVVATLYSPLKLKLSSFWEAFQELVGVFKKEMLSGVLKLVDKAEIAGFVIVSFMSLGFTTNSYILVEDYVTIFFFGSLIVINYLLRVRDSNIKSEHIILSCLAALSSRLSATFFGCRDEQFWCTRTWWLSNDLDMDQMNYRYVASVAVFLSMMFGLYKYQKRQGCLVGGVVRFVHCTIHPVQCVLVVAFWALSTSPTKVLTETQLCCLPCAVYILTIVSVCLVMYSPGTVYLLDTGSGTPRLYGGLSCYSAPALTVYTSLLPACALLLQQGASPALALLTVQLTCMSRLFEGRSVVFKVMVCHVVAVQYFYATGHQAAVQQFDWNAAFVGFTAHPYHVVPVLIMVLRTLMCFILVILYLPTILLHTATPETPAHEIDLGNTTENTAQLQYYSDKSLLPATLSSLLHASTALALLKCTLACVACYIHRRHLMIWNIFTPRMIIEMCFATCSSVVILFVVVLLERTDKKLRDYLDKFCKSS